MKSIVPLLLLTQTHAFTTTPSHKLTSTSRHNVLQATLTKEELSGMSKEDQLKVLGVKEEELALGIDADEVLEFIGT